MNRFDRNRLYPAPLCTSSLRVQTLIWRSPRNHRTGGLVEFSGRYKPGSEGQDDARFIRRSLTQFYELHPVDGIVIDCRALEYDWGDDFDCPNRAVFAGEQVPLVVVIARQQAPAYRYAVSESCLRFDLDAALFEVSEAVRAMKSRF